jgi:uncharacterized delta-60 repeat protein
MVRRFYPFFEPFFPPLSGCPLLPLRRWKRRELMSARPARYPVRQWREARVAGPALHALAFAVQKDGKTLAIGSADTNFAVARINTNGTLDTPFGPRGDGVAQANFGSGTDTPHGIAVQSDGKIVLVGEDSDHHMAVARFDSAGMLDRGLNGGGLKEFDFHTFDGAGRHRVRGRDPE